MFLVKLQKTEVGQGSTSTVFVCGIAGPNDTLSFGIFRHSQKGNHVKILVPHGTSLVTILILRISIST